MKGESLTDDAPTGGFSPNSYGLNLTKSRGLCYFAEASTDRGSTTLTGNIIASAYDKNFLGNDSYHLDDEGAFYTLNGSTFTKRQTVTADTFTLGTSDILQFQGNTFATSATRIIMMTGSDLATVDSSWWTGLTTSYRHPLERVEDTMYIGDVNLVHTWDGTTSTNAAITLPSDVNITSLRKHTDGIHLIAFCGLTADFSHTKGMGGRIYLIDTRIKRWVREIDGVPQIEGSRTSAGVTYVTYGKSIGYFDGNGVRFLKPLDTSSTTYSHNMADWQGTLLIRDGQYMLAYGDLGNGNVWWRPYRNDVNSASINNLCYKGDNKVLISFSDGGTGGYIRELDLTATGVSGFLKMNKTILPARSHISKLDIVHTPTSASATRFSVAVEDTADVPTTIWDSNPTGQTADWSWHNPGLDLQESVIQFTVTPITGAIGFRYFRWHYAPVNT